MIPQQITESTAQFLVRDGGFNLTRRESPPEAIANMLTYWLDGMKGGGEGSCETATAAGAERAKVVDGSALQQHQQDMQQMQQELHEQHDHQQGSLSCASKGVGMLLVGIGSEWSLGCGNSTTVRLLASILLSKIFQVPLIS